MKCRRIFGFGVLTLIASAVDLPRTPAAFSLSAPINVRDYGARGDGGYVSDATISAGSNQLTSASSRFRTSDAGKPIVVVGAGLMINGRPDPLVTTIAAVTGPGTVHLAAPAATHAESAWTAWGTE